MRAAGDATPLDRSKLRGLLNAEGREQQALFAQARAARDAVYGNRVVVRGVIELTNVCRVNCDYCPMRRDNLLANDRYYLSDQEILNCVSAIHAEGINVVLLQGGETPTLVSILERTIPKILEMFGGAGVEVLLNVGNLSAEQYARLREAGATSYILKHETSDPDLHASVRHESLSERLRCLDTLLSQGFKVGTGLISGLPGQTLDSIIDDLYLALERGVHMCSVSPFVPAPRTPLEYQPAGSVDIALNAMACLRIMNPELLIPSVSALEKNRSGGQGGGLAAGANVLTVNFTSDASRDRYLIYGSERFVVRRNHVDRLLEESGQIASQSVFL